MSDEAPVSTPSQTVGPFFHLGLTTPIGRPGKEPADGLRLVVRVFDGDGKPLDDAVVEFWHRGSGSGLERPDAVAGECGRAATGADGSCEMAMSAPSGSAGRAAAHVNLCLFARGLLRQVFTRVYFAGDSHLDSDPVLALVPPARRTTLIARPDPVQSRRWSFDVHLQGPQETVFFDR